MIAARRQGSLVIIWCAVIALGCGALRAQHAEGADSAPVIPEALRLRGDPARTLDLSGTAAQSITRRALGGMVRDLNLVCHTCVEAGQQAVVPIQKGWSDGKLFGADLTMTAPWLKRASGQESVIFYTPRSALAFCLGSAREEGVLPAEFELLQSTFTNLKAADVMLDGHQRAHLWAQRIHRVETAFAELVDPEQAHWARLEDDGTGAREARAELFFFAKEETLRAFAQRAFEPGTWPMSGALLPSGATGAALLDQSKPDCLKRRVAYLAARQFARSFTRFRSTVPPFVEIGLAHYFELRAGGGRFDLCGTFPPGMKAPEDLEALVAEMVLAGKSGALGALAQTPEEGLTPRSRGQAESLIRFLVGLDRAKFGKFMTVLRDSRANLPAPSALRDALKAGYGHDPVMIADAWSAWVRDQGH